MTAALIPGAKKRRIIFVVSAAFGAAILSSAAMSILAEFDALLGFIFILITSVLAASVFAWVFWTRMMRRGESKDEGADAGRNTGLFAIPFATTPYLIFIFYNQMTHSGGLGSTGSFLDVGTALLFIFYGIVLTVFFGGFLAPIIGFYVGQYIAKDPVNEPALSADSLE